MEKARIALVTGGGSGIGEATCYRLAQDGKSIVVLDIDSEAAEVVAQKINSNGGKAIAVGADITDDDAIAMAINNAHQVFGSIGVLVNCAGQENFTAFVDIDSDNWDRMLEINLKGSYNVTQAVLPDMLDRQWGRIINFSSIGAQNGAPQMVHYAAAKGGIIAMTRSLALELGASGITVNAVAPGLINTTMAQRAIKGEVFPVPVEDMVKAYPIPRMGEPAEVATVVAFFASEEAGYITAQLIGVNGGTAV